jgi:hypothetical protein
MDYQVRIPRLALAMLLAALGTGQAQDRWDIADRETPRLSPSVFPTLPPSVRTDLDRRGCAIPQWYGDTVPHNIIQGHFRESNSIDWAVLCSVDRVSTVLVYWAGRADSVAELARGADKGYLQGIGGGRTGFSRVIAPVDGGLIRKHYEWYGGPDLPPTIDHDGINDAFAEKASSVWYWYEGKWLRLQGAD